jgi:aminoglycoside phosphotransferase (APT) family kinase protein
VTLEHIHQLLAYNELQRDVGLEGRGPFIDEMRRSLVDGFDGYCEHAALRARDPALLDRLQRIADATNTVDVPADDVVHYDFSPYNILADGDTITGVVDWQGATSGDATVDLVTLAYYTYDRAAHDALLDAARQRTHPAALRLYAAHMVLRQVDWVLRHDHDDAAVHWHRDFGVAMLDALGAG